MAVTKIRKISSWVLLACTFIMLAVVGLFFFGGNNEPYNGQWNPKYTDILLYWMYALFVITLVAIGAFVVVQFAGNFRTDAKKALVGLGIIILFVLLFVGTYTLGDGTPIPTLAKPDIEEYNTSFWLKLTDMFLYSIYVMGVLTILGVIVGSVKRVFEK
ncbi:MAG: hypothetical protein LBS88_09510 [Tannerellaceae bacterium]|jgi:small-conductance mechanosensitive channel|nr:hypothetical protein [Tannerellaceae bacterium]